MIYFHIPAFQVVEIRYKVAKSELKIPLTRVADLFTIEKERQEANLEKVVDISLTKMEEFTNHPFKVNVNDELYEMADSIKKMEYKSQRLLDHFLMGGIK